MEHREWVGNGDFNKQKAECSLRSASSPDLLSPIPAFPVISVLCIQTVELLILPMKSLHPSSDERTFLVVLGLRVIVVCPSRTVSGQEGWLSGEGGEI